MNFFLPIHYRIGVAFEKTLHNSQLSRKRVAILWLMRAESGSDKSMCPKDIEQLVPAWFGTHGSTTTRALTILVRVIEDPNSTREKRLVLFAKGNDSY